jgi:hypothetical protein
MPSGGRTNPESGSEKSRYPGTFLLAFREAAASAGWQIERWQGDAVACKDANGESLVVGLENLFRRLRRQERTEWPKLIVEFLSKVHVSGQISEMERDLAEVADRLLLRLGPPFPPLPNAAKVWSQPLDETGLVVSLVIDHPETMCYVTEEMIGRSEQPGSHWMQRGLDNLRQRTPQDCLQVIHEESGVHLCAIGDAYDCSRALIVTPYLLEAPFGFFVAVPNRDELLILPMSVAAMPSIHLLKLLARQNHQKAPYPVSDEVYWVHQGKWHRFGIEFSGNEVSIRPPVEFIAVLERLKPSEEG